MLIGRRNLSKEDRDELIRRLAASGHKQKDIAEKVGLSKQRIGEIVNQKSTETVHEPTIKSTSAAEELEAKQREIERLKAEKEALASMQPIAQKKERRCSRRSQCFT